MSKQTFEVCTARGSVPRSERLYWNQNADLERNSQRGRHLLASCIHRLDRSVRPGHAGYPALRRNLLGLAEDIFDNRANLLIA